MKLIDVYENPEFCHEIVAQFEEAHRQTVAACRAQAGPAAGSRLDNLYLQADMVGIETAERVGILFVALSRVAYDCRDDYSRWCDLRRLTNAAGSELACRLGAPIAPTAQSLGLPGYDFPSHPEWTEENIQDQVEARVALELMDHERYLKNRARTKQFFCAADAPAGQAGTATSRGGAGWIPYAVLGGLAFLVGTALLS